MRRVLAVVAMALVVAGAFVSTGCVDQAKYDACLLRNREQEKLLQEREAEVARLQERIDAMQARGGDCQRLLDEKEEHLAAVRRERDAYRQAYEEANAVLKSMAEKPVTVAPGGGGLPEKVALEINMLAQEFPGLFVFDPETHVLRFASDITFDSGSNVVKSDPRQALARLAGILAADVAQGIGVTIVGHTDSVRVAKASTIQLLKELGKEPNNTGLSIARAESVADILTANGVASTRIATRGVGASQPIASNDTKEGRARNRRVEIFLK